MSGESTLLRHARDPQDKSQDNSVHRVGIVKDSSENANSPCGTELELLRSHYRDISTFL